MNDLTVVPGWNDTSQMFGDNYIIGDVSHYDEHDKLSLLYLWSKHNTSAQSSFLMKIHMRPMYHELKSIVFSIVINDIKREDIDKLRLRRNRLQNREYFLKRCLNRRNQQGRLNPLMGHDPYVSEMHELSEEISDLTEEMRKIADIEVNDILHRFMNSMSKEQFHWISDRQGQSKRDFIIDVTWVQIRESIIAFLRGKGANEDSLKRIAEMFPSKLSCETFEEYVDKKVTQLMSMDVDALKNHMNEDYERKKLKVLGIIEDPQQEEDRANGISAIPFHPMIPHGACIDCGDDNGYARSAWKVILCRECNKKRWLNKEIQHETKE